MRKLTARILSLALSMSLVLCAVPQTAFAAELPEIPGDSQTGEQEDGAGLSTEQEDGGDAPIEPETPQSGVQRTGSIEFETLSAELWVWGETGYLKADRLGNRDIFSLWFYDYALSANDIWRWQVGVVPDNEDGTIDDMVLLRCGNIEERDGNVVFRTIDFEGNQKELSEGKYSFVLLLDGVAQIRTQAFDIMDGSINEPYENVREIPATYAVRGAANDYNATENLGKMDYVEIRFSREDWPLAGDWNDIGIVPADISLSEESITAELIPLECNAYGGWGDNWGTYGELSASDIDMSQAEYPEGEYRFVVRTTGGMLLVTPPVIIGNSPFSNVGISRKTVLYGSYFTVSFDVSDDVSSSEVLIQIRYRDSGNSARNSWEVSEGSVKAQFDVSDSEYFGDPGVYVIEVCADPNGYGAFIPIGQVSVLPQWLTDCQITPDPFYLDDEEDLHVKIEIDAQTFTGRTFEAQLGLESRNDTRWYFAPTGYVNFESGNVEFEFSVSWSEVKDMFLKQSVRKPFELTVFFSAREAPYEQMWLELGTLDFVSEHPGAAKILSFNIPGQQTNYFWQEDRYVYIVMPYGSDISALAPTFEVTPGATVSVDGAEQSSGLSAHNFAQQNRIKYVVTSEDGTVSRNYTVEVSIASASTSAYIDQFIIPNLPEGSDFYMNKDEKTVYVIVPAGSLDLTAIAPDLVISRYATVSPKSGEVVDFSGSWAQPVEYTVTSQLPSVKSVYRVTIVERTDTPEVHGTVHLYEKGVQGVRAGVKVQLVERVRKPNGSFYYYEYLPLATTLTDAEGRYDFPYKQLAAFVKVVLDADMMVLHEPGPLEVYNDLYLRNINSGESPTDFHIAKGDLAWYGSVTDSETGEPVKDAVVTNYFDGAFKRTTDKNGIIQPQMIVASAITRLTEVVATPSYDVNAPGYRQSEFRFTLPDDRYRITSEQIREIKTQGSITTPPVALRKLSSEAKILSFKLGGYMANIDHEAKTVKLMLPKGSVVDLVKANPTITFSPDSTYDYMAGSQLNLMDSIERPYIIKVTAEDGKTASAYKISVGLEDDSMVTYVGTMNMIRGGPMVTLPNFTFQVSNSLGIPIANVTTNAGGEFRFTTSMAQGISGVYVVPENLNKFLADNGALTAALFLKPLDDTNEVKMLDVSAIEVRGRVVDEDGQGLPEANVSYSNFRMATSGGEGSFRFGVADKWLSNRVARFDVNKDGYESASFTINLYDNAQMLAFLQKNYVDVGNIVLKEKEADSPFAVKEVLATPAMTQRGKIVQVSVRYKSVLELPDAQLTVRFPDGVELEPGSVSRTGVNVNGQTLQINETIRKDAEYAFVFWVKAGLDYEPDNFIVQADVRLKEKVWSLGEANVILCGLTVELPQQIGINSEDGSSLPFEITGECIAASGYTLNVEVLDPAGNAASFDRPLTGVSVSEIHGLWYKVKNVRILNADKNPGLYRVVATLRDETNRTVDIATQDVYVVPNPLQLTDIHLWSGYMSLWAPKPVDNSSYVTASSTMGPRLGNLFGFDIQTNWKNTSEVVDARYTMVTSHGQYMAVMIPLDDFQFIQGHFNINSYKGSGPAYIYLDITQKNGIVSRFLVGRIMLLVDPSGYVFDRDTGDYIEGATATLEVMEDGHWVEWAAMDYGQHNPQTTDDQGRYGWFVPEGRYRVLVSADGYLDYSTLDDPVYGVINVLPPRDDIYIGMTPLTSGTETYTVTVNNGTGGGSYATGTTVGITANTAPSGQRFKQWVVVSGGVTLQDPQSASTTFQMPAQAVEITAVYENLPDDIYSITVQNDGNGTAYASANSAKSGAEITLTAVPSSGYQFKEWQVVSGGVTIQDNKFTMPAKNVVVAATWSKNKAGNNDSGGRSRGGSVSGNTTIIENQVPLSAPPITWLESIPAGTLADNAKRDGQDYACTKSTGAYGIRKAALTALTGLKYEHDTMDANAVQVRLHINDPAKIAKDVLVSGYIKGSEVGRTRSFFEEWFKNKVQVIHMDQTDPWSQPVEIAARLGLTGMDTKNLYFYSYDKATNTYRRIENPAYWIDQNRYLHFTTEYAGDIIISDGVLMPKGQNTK